MKYSIDTSALLDGWVRYYPPDVFPSLWDKIDELVSSGILLASEEVLFELEKRDDEIFNWAKNKTDLFIPIDENIQKIVSDILAKFPKLIDQRKNRSGADPFIIALAIQNNCYVISGEGFSKKLDRPKIPDVCQQLKVGCLNMLQMFRNEGWIFK